MVCNATLLVVRTLSRYFATRYLGMFAVILVVSTVTIVIIEMLLNLDDMLSADHGPGAPIQYLILRIPSYYLRELLPMTSFAAAFFTLGLSSHWYEIFAARAGGISPGRLVAPILIAAIFLAFASFVLGETWIINSTREWNRHETGGGAQISFREGSFWYQRGLAIYNIAEADAMSHVAGYCVVNDVSERNFQIRMEGQWTKGKSCDCNRRSSCEWKGRAPLSGSSTSATPAFGTSLEGIRGCCP